MAAQVWVSLSSAPRIAVPMVTATTARAMSPMPAIHQRTSPVSRARVVVARPSP